MASFVAPAMSSFAAARLEKERIAILARRTEFYVAADRATVCRAEACRVTEAGATASAGSGGRLIASRVEVGCTKSAGAARDLRGRNGSRTRAHHNFLIVPHCTLAAGIGLCDGRGGGG